MLGDGWAIAELRQPVSFPRERQCSIHEESPFFEAVFLLPRLGHQWFVVFGVMITQDKEFGYDFTNNLSWASHVGGAVVQ